MANIIPTSGGAHLHLPIRHVMRAILHAAEDLLNLRRKHMRIFGKKTSVSVLHRSLLSKNIVGMLTLDTQELPHFQGSATHLRKLCYQTSDVCFCKEERWRL